MKRFVLDAVTAASWPLAWERHEQAVAVLRALASGAEAVVPAVWPYELSQIVNGALERGYLPRESAEEFGELLEDAVAGDIVALVGPKRTRTGDTLCPPDEPILLELYESTVVRVSSPILPVVEEERLVDLGGHEVQAFLDRVEHCLRSPGDADLLEDAVEVRLDGSLADAQ